MKFDLRDLQCFVRVAEESSFTKAAEKLFISQPSLSRKLHELEERLGVRLLERTTRRVCLTEAGDIFYRHAQQVLSGCEALEEEMRLIRDGSRGLLRLCYGSSAQFDFAMRLSAAMSREYPDIQVIAQGGDLLEALFTGEQDAIILMRCEVEGQDWLGFLPLERATGLSAFFSAEDVLARMDGPVSIAQLHGRRLLLPRKHNLLERVDFTTLHDAIRNWLIVQNVPERLLSVANGAQAFSLAITGQQMVGIMPDSSQVIASEHLRCKPIAECREGFELALAWNHENEQNRSVQRLREVAESCLRA